MKWSTVPVLAGCASFGAFCRFGFAGPGFLAVCSGILTAVFAYMYYVAKMAEIESGEESATERPPQRTPSARVGHQPRYEQVDLRPSRQATQQGGGINDTLISIATHAQAFTEVAAEGAFRAAHGASAAYGADPKYWRGAIFAGLALLSAVGGMLDWWSAWKGLHLAGVLALLSTGFFLQKYDKVSELLEFISENKAAFWLAASVAGLVVTPIHKNWPMGPLLAGFILSGLAALVTLLDKWEVVGKFVGTWLFAKEWVSLLIWLLLAVAGLFAFISPTLLLNKAVTGMTVGVMAFYAIGLIALVAVGLTALWRKLAS